MKTTLRLFILVCVVLACACQKYVDKQTTGDPRLTNPYCNDPNAVNYNWGFPGRPDDSICFYPNSLFIGKYVYYDTIYQADLTPSFSKIDTLYITSSSYTALTMSGLCAPGDSLHLTAGISYVATLDTTIVTGQPLCRIQDTVNGTLTKNLSDTLPLLHVYFMVTADTGITYHIGYAQKIN